MSACAAVHRNITQVYFNIARLHVFHVERKLGFSELPNIPAHTDSLYLHMSGYCFCSRPVATWPRRTTSRCRRAIQFASSTTGMKKILEMTAGAWVDSRVGKQPTMVPELTRPGVDLKARETPPILGVSQGSGWCFLRKAQSVFLAPRGVLTCCRKSASRIQ